MRACDIWGMRSTVYPQLYPLLKSFLKEVRYMTTLEQEVGELKARVGSLGSHGTRSRRRCA